MAGQRMGLVSEANEEQSGRHWRGQMLTKTDTLR